MPSNVAGFFKTEETQKSNWLKQHNEKKKEMIQTTKLTPPSNTFALLGQWIDKKRFETSVSNWSAKRNTTTHKWSRPFYPLAYGCPLVHDLTIQYLQQDCTPSKWQKSPKTTPTGSMHTQFVWRKTNWRHPRLVPNNPDSTNVHPPY